MRSVPLLVLLLSVAFFCRDERADAACQSCVFLPPHNPYRHREMIAVWGGRAASSANALMWKQVVVHKASRVVQRTCTTKPILVTAVGIATFSVAHRRRTRSRRLLSKPWSSSSEGDKAADGSTTSSDDAESEPDDSNTEAEPSVVSDSMISALGFYKAFISPLLPPACRFVPTCSQYGVQAIKEFGPGKGTVLIAWRLMRCSPFGGKGYDPPRWPPVSYTHGSWDDLNL